jgi:AcrR family transcriptional regulator
VKVSSSSKPGTRSYHAPRREAAAARTRRRVLAAGKREFERSGWVGTTVGAVARRAAVSPKTVEALFGTKATLLEGVVDFAIRGDERPIPIDRRRLFAEMEAAPTAGRMLDLHAAQVRQISERAARIAWVVEHAAPADPDLRRLWRRMTKNRHTGVRWATDTLLSKPDAPTGLDAPHLSETFWLALDWGTYRTLTEHMQMDADGFQAWLRRYYRQTLGR